MLLGNLLKSTSKNYRKIPVKGISFDSRKVKKSDIFFGDNFSLIFSFLINSSSHVGEMRRKFSLLFFKIKNLDLLLLARINLLLKSMLIKY